MRKQEKRLIVVLLQARQACYVELCYFAYYAHAYEVFGNYWAYYLNFKFLIFISGAVILVG